MKKRFIMDKKRFDQFQKYSITGKNKPDIDLTYEEFVNGYHFCYDWDELFIGPECPEFQYCNCFDKGEMS